MVDMRWKCRSEWNQADGEKNNCRKRWKRERDEGDGVETARREDEEMEVKGQEEGGEGSSDPSQSSLLKCVRVR